MTMTGSLRSNSYEAAVTTARLLYAPSISSNSTGAISAAPRSRTASAH